MTYIINISRKDLYFEEMLFFVTSYSPKKKVLQFQKNI